MGRQLKGLLYFFITDARHSFYIFWSILISTLSVSVAISYLLRNNDMQMIFALSFPIYIYCSIFGFTTVKEGIPFSIKMGATRRNLFLSLGIFFLGLALLKAVMANTLQTIISSITNGLGLETFVLMHPAQLLDNTWFTRVTIDTSIMFFLLTAIFLLGLVFYKYGLLGGGGGVGIVVIVLLLGIAQGWITDFFIDLYQSLDIIHFYQVLLIGIVLYGISWVILRKITSVKIR